MVLINWINTGQQTYTTQGDKATDNYFYSVSGSCGFEGVGGVQQLVLGNRKARKWDFQAVNWHLCSLLVSQLAKKDRQKRLQTPEMKRRSKLSNAANNAAKELNKEGEEEVQDGEGTPRGKQKLSNVDEGLDREADKE